MMGHNNRSVIMTYRCVVPHKNNHTCRVKGPVMDFLNVKTVDVLGTHGIQVKEDPQRSLLLCDGCPADGYSGPKPAPDLSILVVRPQLPAGCSPTNALVGGCDIPVRR